MNIFLNELHCANMSNIKNSTNQACPVSSSLDIFGDRWTLLVLRDVLLESRHSYKELMFANPGIATSVLADRLKRLESRGLLTKNRDLSDARQFVYHPTDLAIAVIPMLVEMIVWGSRHGNASVGDLFMEKFDTDREKLIFDLQVKARESAGLPG